MKGVSIFILLALFSLSIQASNPFSPPANLKIAAFNIEIFGRAKMKKPEVVKYLVKIIKRYDIILIQEIRDKSGKAIKDLLKEVNKSDQYEMVISQRIGRSSMKEQYAFFYRPAKAQVIGQYQYPDRGLPNDEFHREPFVVRFKANNGFDFSLIGIHTDPDIAVKEIDNLTKVYNSSVRELGEKDALILGDFNAECKYVKPGEWGVVSLWTDNRFNWLIGNEVDTTVSATDCAYDRIVATGEMIDVAYSAGVFNFESEFRLDNEFAKKISDHFPVEVKID